MAERVLTEEDIPGASLAGREPMRFVLTTRCEKLAKIESVLSFSRCLLIAVFLDVTRKV